MHCLLYLNGTRLQLYIMTLYIIIISVVISLACFSDTSLYHKLILNPYQVKHRKQWYRMLTSGFMHADYIHLLVNMLVLFSFGRNVEVYYAMAFGDAGPYMYVLLYLSAIVAANASTQFKYQNSSYYNSLGASGAVSAILFTSILFAPLNTILLYGIIKLPGIVWAIAYLAFSVYMGKKQSDNINHEAHYYGAIYGVLFTIVLKPTVFIDFINHFLN